MGVRGLSTNRVRQCLPEILLSAASLSGLLLFHGTRAWSEPFWWDELITANLIDRGPLEIALDRFAEAHSPIYFVLVKYWMLLVSGPSGLHSPDEILLRLPSFVAVGFAGGLLAAAAWRAWGALPGLLLVPLWCLHSVSGYYAFEGRPYGFLILMLALSIWSSTRLWLEEKRLDAPMRRRTLWVVSAASPVVAAALIPLGAAAVIAMELSIGSQQFKGVAIQFTQRWRLRSTMVWLLVACVVAVYLSMLLKKEQNHWTDKAIPFSLNSIEAAIGAVVLQSSPLIIGVDHVVIFAGIVLAVLAAAGLVVMRHDFLGRMAAGLALGYPIAMVALSAVTSVLHPRYFIPMLPGILLLAAGSAGYRSRKSAAAVVAVSLFLIAVAFAWKNPRLIRYGSPTQQLEILEAVRPDAIKGAATDAHILQTLRYYIPRRIGVPANLQIINGPMKIEDLPQDDELFWVFSLVPSTREVLSLVPSKREARKWLEGLPVVCHYALENGSIYVLARSPEALPASRRGCNPVAPGRVPAPTD